VMSSLIILSWLVGALISYIIKRRFPVTENSAQANVLPVYHIPAFKTFIHAVFTRTMDFLGKITHVVIISAVVMWFLATFPLGSDFESSYASAIGRTLAPIGTLAGLNWKLIVALLFGFFAKETTLSTLGVLYHASHGLGNLSTILAEHISPLVGLTFLVIYMFYTPCAAAVITIRKESKSLWFAILSICVSLLVAGVLGTLIYNVGSLILLIIGYW
ncbi:MAG: nucleoside recognition domain-containing protein, partial [Syntrophomonadaceae bacterium]